MGKIRQRPQGTTNVLWLYKFDDTALLNLIAKQKCKVTIYLAIFFYPSVHSILLDKLNYCWWKLGFSCIA